MATNNISDPYDEQKALHGKFTTIIWIVGSVILFVGDGGISNLLTWQAAAFISVGMFVAALVVGNVTYWLQRTTAKMLMKRVSPDQAFTAEAAKKISRLGKLLLLFDFVLATGVLLWCYASFFWLNP